MVALKLEFSFQWLARETTQPRLECFIFQFPLQNSSPNMFKSLIVALSLASAAVVEGARSFEECMRGCGRNIAYVCATNGATYANYCEFEIYQCMDPEIRVAHWGKC